MKKVRKNRKHFDLFEVFEMTLSENIRSQSSPNKNRRINKTVFGIK